MPPLLETAMMLLRHSLHLSRRAFGVVSCSLKSGDMILLMALQGVRSGGRRLGAYLINLLEVH